MQISNATQLDVFAFPQVDKSRKERCVICARATFSFDKTGTVVQLENSQPFNLVDDYYSAPKSSSLRLASDLCYEKSKVDIYFVDAEATAPEGLPTKHWNVSVQVGSVEASFVATGRRQWVRSFIGSWKCTETELCARVPVRFENAFGGYSPSGVFCTMNPVGRGFMHPGDINAATEIDIPQLISKSDTDRVFKGPGNFDIVGLTPLAPSWSPRLKAAGTYDERWQQEDWPNWPNDFDESFFNCAPLRLQSNFSFNGGEPVVFHGLSPQTMGFQLPQISGYFAKMFSMQSALKTQPMCCDTLIFDMKLNQLTVVWRTSVAVQERTYLVYIDNVSRL